MELAVAPVAFEYVPAPHLLHAVGPLYSLKVPGGQAEQAPLDPKNPALQMQAAML